jgi:hypothetical protein
MPPMCEPANSPLTVEATNTRWSSSLPVPGGRPPLVRCLTEREEMVLQPKIAGWVWSESPEAGQDARHLALRGSLGHRQGFGGSLVTLGSLHTGLMRSPMRWDELAVTATTCQQLDFLIAAHGLTGVTRLNRLLDGSRGETSA